MSRITFFINFLFGLVFFFSVSLGTQAEVSVLGDYPSPEAVYSEVAKLAADYPNIISVDQYGKSVEGRPLLSFRIGRRDGKNRPEALFGANIHGNEYIGNRVAMGIAHRLLNGEGHDEWITSLLDRMDFYFLPCINPDGYAKTWEMKGAEPWAIQRKNAHGVDLNRNFPMPGKKTIPLNWAGSKNPEHLNYKGPRPYSEPETKAIGDFVEKHRFFVALDFHSYGGQIIPARCPNHRCVVLYKQMAEAFQQKQKHVQYYRLQFRLLDTFTGEMEDMLLYQHGVLAACIEIGNTKYNKPAYEKTGNPFWRSNPLDWRFWVENDVDASLAAVEKAFALTSGEPIPLQKRQ